MAIVPADEFVAFAQLGGGLGEVSVHVDIRRAADGRLVRPTAPRLVELHCDNTWVADVSFEVVEGQP